MHQYLPIVRIRTLRNKLSGNTIIILTLIAGLALRVFFAWHLPFTFDEGAYLYDAKLLASYMLPQGDVLTKTPVFVDLVALGIKIFGSNLFIGRVVSIMADLITAIALKKLGEKLHNKKLGLIAGAIWLITSGSIVLTVYGHTQAVAISMACWAMVFWIGALQDASENNKRKIRYAFAAGVFLALAYATRKTMIAAVLPAFIFWLISRKNRVVIFSAAGGGLFVILLWAMLIYWLYGWPGVAEVIGIGYGNIVKQYATQMGSVGRWGSDWTRMLKIALQIFSPLLILSLIACVFRKHIVPFGVGVVWLAVTVGLYTVWPALMPEYLADLLPGLVLVSSVGALALWQWRPVVAKIILLLIFIGNAASLVAVYHMPLTGAYTRESLVKAVSTLSDQVPKNEPVLTAAAIVPYLSGHQIYGNITHPLWYGYHFVDSNTRNVFLPPIKQIEDDYVAGKIKWALTDTVTAAAYFSNQLPAPWDESDRWSRVGAIKNTVGSVRNPLLLWRLTD